MSMLGFRQGQANPWIPGFPGFGVPKLALVDGHGPWAWARGPWTEPGLRDSGFTTSRLASLGSIDYLYVLS
jgi:hypothetical protein